MRSESPHGESQCGLSNQDIITIALYLTGGDSHSIDTEDIAVKANELAPGRFCWRKYKEQINIDTVRKRLWDARRPEKGGYVFGSEKDGWMLTQAGVSFAKANELLIGHDSVRQRRSLTERHWIRSERVRIENSDAIATFRSDGADAVTKNDVEALFRLNDYINGSARTRKVNRLLSAFPDDSELGEALRLLAARLDTK